MKKGKQKLKHGMVYYYPKNDRLYICHKNSLDGFFLETHIKDELSYFGFYAYQLEVKYLKKLPKIYLIGGF